MMLKKEYPISLCVENNIIDVLQKMLLILLNPEFCKKQGQNKTVKKLELQNHRHFLFLVCLEIDLVIMKELKFIYLVSCIAAIVSVSNAKVFKPCELYSIFKDHFPSEQINDCTYKH